MGKLLAIAWVTLRVTRSIRDVPTAVIVQFCTTFGVWILADRLGLSPVLTMVCFAIAVARRAPASTPARIRIPSYAVWETAVFLLNVLAFVFIGLQIRPILSSLDPGVRARYLWVSENVNRARDLRCHRRDRAGRDPQIPLAQIHALGLG